MDLKERKRITNLLPGFTNWWTSGMFENQAKLQPGLNTNFGSTKSDPLRVGGTVGGSTNTEAPTAAGAGPWFALGTWAGGGVAAGLNAMRSKEQMLQDVGTTSGSAMGFGYQKYNDVDVDKEMKQYYTQAGASFLTNPFKGFTMLFGGASQRRKLEAAKREALARNEYNRAGAIGEYIAQNEKLNSTPDGGTLYAANGKDVHTAQGYSTIAPNARVEGQEVIRDPYTESSHIVPGPANGDNNYANLKPSDIVYTDKFGISKIAQQAVKAQQAAQKDMKTRGPIGRATAQLAQAEATKVLDELAQTQAQLRQAGLLGEEQYAAAKNGKDMLPGFKLGRNWWIDGLGALTGLGQAFGSALQKVKVPTSYRTNPYEQQALSTLAGLRINPYSIYRDMLNQQRYAQYNLNNAGGLSGSQKALANVGLATGLMNTYGKLNQDIQEQNNKYRSDYATKLLAAGDADRQQLIKSNAYDLDYYSKAHAAKQKMVETGIKNWLAALQQGVANQFKLYNANKTINRYDSEYNF